MLLKDMEWSLIDIHDNVGVYLSKWDKQKPFLGSDSKSISRISDISFMITIQCYINVQDSKQSASDVTNQPKWPVNPTCMVLKKKKLKYPAMHGDNLSPPLISYVNKINTDIDWINVQCSLLNSQVYFLLQLRLLPFSSF